MEIQTFDEEKSKPNLDFISIIFFIMSHNLDFILFTFFPFMASSHPIASDPQDHVAPMTPLTKTLVLKSSDGEKFEVELQVALQSETIKQMIVDDGGFSNEMEMVLSFPNIIGETMGKVLEYCNKHDEATDNIIAMDQMKAFDTEFVNVHEDILYRVLLAANYLNIKSLLDLTCEKVKDNVKGLTPEEMRKTFNIKDDFTPEEEGEFCRENTSAFQ